LHSSGREALALAESERWFLVHTHPKGERRAQLHLGGQGFRTHLPQIRKTIRHARQLRTVRTALFPRYLFIVLDLGRDRWLSVRILTGPFAYFVGTLERLDDAGRVRVLLEMMGTAVPVALHRSALSPAA